MKELAMKYKAYSGEGVDVELEFNKLDEKEKTDEVFLSNFYLVDKDFMDWIIERASRCDL